MLVGFDQEQLERIARSVPGAAEHVQDIYPLSPLQEGILFHHLLNEQSDTYVLSTLFELDSRVHVERFIDALQRVIDRHDVLRSAMHWENLPRAVQVVQRHAQLPVELMELAPDRDVLEQLKDRLGPAHWRFDVRVAPLLRLQIAEDRRNGCWYALLRVHHLICDHQSLRVVLAEAMEMMAGRGHMLPPAAPFRSYVMQALAESDGEVAERFFRGKLGDIAEPTAPFGLLDVHTDGSRIEEAREQVDAALAGRIRTQALKSGTSAARLFHAAWALVLASASGRDDVVFGTVLLSARRRRDAGGRRMLGMSVNTLPLRIRVRGSSALELVKHTHEELTQLLQYEHTPLVLAQRCSGIGANVPLFTALLNYRHSKPDPATTSEGADGVRIVAGGEAWSNYPISVTVDDIGDGFLLTAQTDRRVEPQRVIRYLSTALEVLVDALERRPEAAAGELSILPDSERQQILETFNVAATAYPRDSLIHQIFEAQVLRTPDATALFYESASLSYAELNARANRLARKLRGQGVGPDQLVALCAERGLDLIVGLLAVWKAGGAYVALDPEHPAERLSYMLQDAAPRVLLTQRQLSASVPRSAATVVPLDDDDAADGPDPGNLDAASIGLKDRHLAYVIYTSGSTGQPKGVMIEHRHVVNLWHGLEQVYRDAPACAKVGLNASLNFDASVQQLVQLLSGRTLYPVPPACRRDASLLLQFIQQHGLEGIDCTPSQLKSWIRAGLLESRSCPLRLVLVGGEAIDAELWSIAARSERIAFFNVYGPTECTVDCTVARLNGDTGGAAHIGRPMRNRRILILNRGGQLVPIGVMGEIHVGGEGVGRGYLNQPRLTAERFVPDPSSAEPGARLYKTGDLARWRNDGTIEYLGRNDFQVKVRGFRIELGEIEAQLLRHPQVSDAAVIVREDVPGDKRLVAYVVPAGPATDTADVVRAHLKAVLPQYMVPSAIVIVARLPLTINGKLDSKSLPVPDLGAYANQAYEPPQNELEQMVANVWQELLRVERVGRHDNFFELGGHSLLVVQMLERLQRVGITAEVRKVFEAPTLAEFTSSLAGAMRTFEVPPNLIPPGCELITPQMVPLVWLEPEHIRKIADQVPGGAANIQDIYPLGPLQEGILFHHLLDESRADTYVVVIQLSVQSRQRLDELIAALQAVIDRHDILRTAVMWEQLPQAVQVVHRRAPLLVEQIELDDDSDPAQQIAAWLEPQRKRIDLRTAPLIQMHVATRRHTEECHVALKLHHIIADNTSQEMLIGEVLAHLEGRADDLPEPLPYRDYVAHAVAYRRSSDSETFFRMRLAGIDEPTAPFGLTDVHGDGSDVHEAHDTLDQQLQQRVREQARRLRVSVASIFHAAWGLVVARTSGRADVVFGSVLLGRLQPNAGAQRTLGLFINTLPLRLQLQDVSVRELVEQTQLRLAELLGHEQASLAVAQRCSGISGSAPLFTSLFNYRNSAGKSALGWSAVQGVRVQGIYERTNYPISFSIDDLGTGFAFTAKTDRRVDSRRLIAYVQTGVQSLVDALEHAPQCEALGLNILPEAERRAVVSAYNATRKPFPHELLVHQLFEANAQRTPDALALIYDEETLTYGELNRRANQLARYLRERGIGPEQLVAICIDRSLEMIIAVLGTLKAGGAYVPLDPNYPPGRLQYILEDARPRLLVTLRRHLDAIPATAVECIALDDARRDIARQSTDDLTADRHGSSTQLAYVIYTSGSTGRPKGVMVEHRNVLSLWQGLEQIYQRSAPCARIAVNASLNFDASVKQYIQLLSGRTVVLIPQEIRVDLPELSRYLQRFEVDAIDCTPSQLKAWLSASLLESRQWRCKVVLIGGEPIDAALWRTLARFRATRFYNLYGPTESTVDATFAPVSDESPEPHIGRPMQNRAVYVLDERTRPVPIGVVGEMFIGGAGVARGYCNRPDLTAQRFPADPFHGCGRLYRTGDLGRWRADGTIEYCGRNDNQVKIRGIRIELEEIEAQLLRHEQVNAAVVVAREDGIGEKRLVAYVVPRAANQAPAVEADTLRSYLAASLPEYMVPAAFVLLESLPLTPSGKVDRRALPAQQLSAHSGAATEAPRGPVETRLAGIWQELIGRPQIGRDENLFDLGAHSLLVLHALFKMNAAFGTSLRVADVYRSPTVRELAARVGGSAKEDRRIDLATEAVLDPQIGARPGLRSAPGGAILLTGGTGFVGRFLLAGLLEQTDRALYCLVRAPSQQEAARRLRQSLSHWGLWQDRFEQRISAVPGNLRHPQLGLDGETYEVLSREVGTIYHCATSMNHLETYEMAKAANVGAVSEILQLATQRRLKLINYISTLSIFQPAASGTTRIIREDTPIEQEMHRSSNGYAASKWVAEKLFMLGTGRGIPCNIFRLGLVWADSVHGRYDELQRIYRIIKSCLLSGYGIMNYRTEMPPTPVDYVARAIICLAQRHRDGGGVFHISSPHQPSEGIFERCNDILGTALQLLPYYDWICEMKRLHEMGHAVPAAPLIEFAFSMDAESFAAWQRSSRSASVRFDIGRTHAELEHARVFAPVLDDEVLKACILDMLARDPQLRDMYGLQGSQTGVRSARPVRVDGVRG